MNGYTGSFSVPFFCKISVMKRWIFKTICTTQEDDRFFATHFGKPSWQYALITGKKTDYDIIFPSEQEKEEKLSHKTPWCQPFDTGLKMIWCDLKMFLKDGQICIDKGSACRIDVENSCIFDAHITDAPFS